MKKFLIAALAIAGFTGPVAAEQPQDANPANTQQQQATDEQSPEAEGTEGAEGASH